MRSASELSSSNFTPGHTPGQQVLFSETAKDPAVVPCGDLFHYPEERAQYEGKHRAVSDSPRFRGKCETPKDPDYYELFQKKRSFRVYAFLDPAPRHRARQAINYLVNVQSRSRPFRRKLFSVYGRGFLAGERQCAVPWHPGRGLR